MDTVTWRELSKLLRLALMGIGAAIAVFVVSVLLGFGSSSASAAEDEDPGLLGAVTGLVGDTTSLVGSTVTGVTSVATEVVTTVVAVAPAPVQQPVAEVVQTVGTTVGTVVAPVQEAVSTEVVTNVTAPVVDVVTAVPVVGDVVSGLGLDLAISEIAADVDTTLATVIGAVSDTGTGLAPANPVVPDAEGAIVPQSPAPASLASFDGVNTTAAPAPAVAARQAASVTVPPLAVAGTVSVLATAGIAAVDISGVMNSMGALCLSVISSGSGGAGLGVWAIAALLPFVAHRAWVRRAGPENELAPAAPAGSTDVSPD